MREYGEDAASEAARPAGKFLGRSDTQDPDRD